MTDRITNFWTPLDPTGPGPVFGPRERLRDCRMCAATFTVGFYNTGQKYCTFCQPIAAANRIKRSTARHKARVEKGKA